ncbi:MAG: L,D-transpeptidase family protein [Pseudomonadota bacterium]
MIVPRDAATASPTHPPGAGGAAARDDLVVGPWGARLQGVRLPCSVGRGGISESKVEGDGVTPAGVYRLLWLYWRADRQGPPLSALDALPLGPQQGWAETPEDPDYNCPVRHPHGFPADRMARGDGLYDLCAVTDQNQARIPGAGSAIFVHQWRKPRHPTAGCVAFRRRDLVWILGAWRPWSRLVIRLRGGL